MNNALRRLVSEFLGTAFLLAAVIGSGIMSERLAGGNVGIALLSHILAIIAALVVLITIFGPVSGAHFNPVVTLAFVMRREIGARLALAYVATQFIGAIAGVWAAHLMFEQPVFQISTKLREGMAIGFSEFVATFGLFATIFGCIRYRPAFTPTAVALYIMSAIWFTASTSFANPAVTVARCLSDTFAGIAPSSVPLYIAAQIVATLVAVPFFGWLFKEKGL